MPKPSRNNHIDFVELPVNTKTDLTRVKAFYSSAFGWSYQDWGDDYADSRDSGIGSGLNADADHRSGAPLVVIYADDLEALRAKVVAAHGVITRDIFAFPGGRRFHFKDPTGNELAVWSDH